MATMFEKTVAMPVKYEMLYVGQWRQNLLLADRYSDGRVFLAGRRRASRDPDRRARYEHRRRRRDRPVVEARRRAAGLGRSEFARLLRGRAPPDRRQERGGVAPRLPGPAQMARDVPARTSATPRPRAAHRAALAQIADLEQRKTNEMIGAELGYRYLGSPIVAPEEGEPFYDFMEYRPTTCPGARLPHVWLDDGSAMQDRIGYDHGFTLLGSAAALPMRHRSPPHSPPTGRRYARSACPTPGARRLRPRPAPAAPRHARRLARQRPARRHGAGGARDWAVEAIHPL